jgi:hypothetical protein
MAEAVIGEEAAASVRKIARVLIAAGT